MQSIGTSLELHGKLIQVRQIQCSNLEMAHIIIVTSSVQKIRFGTFWTQTLDLDFGFRTSRFKLGTLDSGLLILVNILVFMNLDTRGAILSMVITRPLIRLIV